MWPLCCSSGLFLWFVTVSGKCTNEGRARLWSPEGFSRFSVVLIPCGSFTISPQARGMSTLKPRQGAGRLLRVRVYSGEHIFFPARPCPAGSTRSSYLGSCPGSGGGASKFTELFCLWIVPPPHQIQIITPALAAARSWGEGEWKQLAGKKP